MCRKNFQRNRFSIVWIYLIKWYYVIFLLLYRIYQKLKQFVIYWSTLTKGVCINELSRLCWLLWPFFAYASAVLLWTSEMKYMHINNQCSWVDHKPNQTEWCMVCTSKKGLSEKFCHPGLELNLIFLHSKECLATIQLITFPSSLPLVG